MRTIKPYFKGAPFYNAFLRTWPLELRQATLGPTLWQVPCIQNGTKRMMRRMRSAGTQEVSMNRFNKFLVAAFMSAAMLLPSMVQAMEIRQFDKMAVPDQSDYVGLLVQGAEKIL